MNGSLTLLIFICIAHCLSDSSDSSQTGQDDSHLSDEDQSECKNESKQCSDLSNLCLNCPTYNNSINCRYGEWIEVNCTVPKDTNCTGNRGEIIKKARCVFCYQTETWEHSCAYKTSCIAIRTPLQYYKTNCTVHPEVMCLGRRHFQKKLRCNWTRGHKWSTALLLSITLGGFGADRFYLGHWQEGIGKLFSFGGLGVWTLVDVLLIAIRYLGPADGSFYV